MLISFIIPTYNEENNVGKTIEKINKHVPLTYKYEIIVVDHGSTDRTVHVARECGANVFNKPEGTIGALRNYGVMHSKGEVLVFIDADVLLTTEWQVNIGRVVELICSGERIITGSWYSVPDNTEWIEIYWFMPLQKRHSTHINSGHMIMSRDLFGELSGFDERLETGEDYDVSMRAKELGIYIDDNKALKVVHMGYPKTIVEFIKREYWHGKGDADSISTLLTSKVAVISLVFILLHIMLIVSVIAVEPFATLVSVIALIVIIAGSTLFKYSGESIKTFIVNSFLYYFYFWARAFSIISLAGMRRMRKRTR